MLNYICFCLLHIKSPVYLCSFALPLHNSRHPSIVRITPLKYTGSTYLGPVASLGAVQSRVDGHRSG